MRVEQAINERYWAIMWNQQLIIGPPCSSVAYKLQITMCHI